MQPDSQNLEFRYVHFAWPCLVAKFKISKLLHSIGILHVWSIKYRQNKKKLIA